MVRLIVAGGACLGGHAARVSPRLHKIRRSKLIELSVKISAPLKLRSPKLLAYQTKDTGAPRKLWQLPRNGVVAIATGSGPVTLTIGSRKSESAGRQVCGRGSFRRVRTRGLLFSEPSEVPWRSPPPPATVPIKKNLACIVHRASTAELAPTVHCRDANRRRFLTATSRNPMIP